MKSKSRVPQTTKDAKKPEKKKITEDSRKKKGPKPKPQKARSRRQPKTREVYPNSPVGLRRVIVGADVGEPEEDFVEERAFPRRRRTPRRWLKKLPAPSSDGRIVLPPLIVDPAKFRATQSDLAKADYALLALRRRALVLENKNTRMREYLRLYASPVDLAQDLYHALKRHTDHAGLLGLPAFPHGDRHWNDVPGLTKSILISAAAELGVKAAEALRGAIRAKEERTS